MRTGALPYAAFAGCAAIWSSTFLAIRVGNDALPPLWACSLRLALAALLLGAYMVLTRQVWPRGPALTAAVCYGLMEFGVALPLLYWGEASVASGLAAVLYAVSPLASMVGERAAGIAPWNAARLSAALIGLGGVGVVFWRQVADGGSAAGMLSVAAAAVVSSVGPIALQRGPRQSAVGANTVGTLVAVPCALLASLALRESHPAPASPSQYGAILYLAIASSVVAFGLFAWLVNRWRASTIAFLGVIVPVTALMLGVVVRHETFSPGSFAGAGIVLLAVVVAIRSEDRKRGSPSVPLEPASAPPDLSLDRTRM